MKKIINRAFEKTLHKQTGRTPEIEFSDGKLRIWGTFVPEDPAEFYQLLHQWVMDYSTKPASETIVDIGIKYTGGFWMPFIQKLLKN